MKIVVAITGASGVVLGLHLLKNLKDFSCYVILSDAAKKICRHEVIDVNEIESLAHRLYSEDDIEADLSSSSFTAMMNSMIIVPCSLKTMSAIANGFCDNLITRCAENFLKFNQRLIIVPRDTPLSLSAIENMKKIKMSGGIIIPPNMAYYYKPESIDDVTDFFVGKILDALGIEHTLYRRWG